MKQILFTSPRVLPAQKRERAWTAFTSYLAKQGITDPLPFGQMFAALDNGRVFGGVWLRSMPTQPGVGEVHVVASKSRFRDITSVRALTYFLTSRAGIMGIDRWRAYVAVGEPYALPALKVMGFKEAGRVTLPVVGACVILEKEVV